jgi:hypothetical protein
MWLRVLACTRMLCDSSMVQYGPSIHAWVFWHACVRLSTRTHTCTHETTHAWSIHTKLPTHLYTLTHSHTHTHSTMQHRQEAWAPAGITNSNTDVIPTAPPIEHWQIGAFSMCVCVCVCVCIIYVMLYVCSFIYSRQAGGPANSNTRTDRGAPAWPNPTPSLPPPMQTQVSQCPSIYIYICRICKHRSLNVPWYMYVYVGSTLAAALLQVFGGVTHTYSTMRTHIYHWCCKERSFIFFLLVRRSLVVVWLKGGLLLSLLYVYRYITCIDVFIVYYYVVLYIMYTEMYVNSFFVVVVHYYYIYWRVHRVLLYYIFIHWYLCFFLELVRLSASIYNIHTVLLHYIFILYILMCIFFLLVRLWASV